MYVLLLKQNTAYGMRISDWSSDVCSSNLRVFEPRERLPLGRQVRLVDILGNPLAPALLERIEPEPALTQYIRRFLPSAVRLPFRPMPADRHAPRRRTPATGSVLHNVGLDPAAPLAIEFGRASWKERGFQYV